jgi:hypothetical protein
MEKSDDLSTLDDVYRKFGDVSEAAQLLETELGTMLLFEEFVQADLLTEPDKKRAAAILGRIDRRTLGQLVKNLNDKSQSLVQLDDLLSRALEERNRLSHSFYRQHNFRRNFAEGRAIMMKDLESIHQTLPDAYKAVMLLSGVDLEAEVAAGRVYLPTRHVKI